MSKKRVNASDANYHSRHASRTLERARRIAASIDGQVRVLDVGCNNGITSKFLLDSGKASHVTGIELHASTVDQALRDHADFELIEGNIVDIDLAEKFDVIIYGAVHHHILRFNGLTVAMQTMQKLIVHCNGYLFFETGQLGEGGRWPWQQAMRRLFRTDEEHFYYLIRGIEPYISGFKIIGRFWIHGIRRAYFRFDVSAEDSPALGDEEPQPWPKDLEGPFVRTWGSRNQTLLLESDSSGDDSPVRFWTSGEDSGYFLKQHVHHPISARFEYQLGKQLNHDWSIRPIGHVEQPTAIVFPWLTDAASLQTFRSSPGEVRRKIANQVIDIHKKAVRTRVNSKAKVLLKCKNPALLTDVCDLNINNFLVRTENGADQVYAVDFEQQSTCYRHRNRLHLARALWVLGSNRAAAVFNFLAGTLGELWLVATRQLQPLEARIIARQPGIASLLVSDFRTVAGRALGRLLALVGLGER